MTGFSDEFLLATAKYLNEGDNLLAKPLPYYRYGAEPDVWFKPTLVWEVHAAGISLSPTYPAAAHLVHLILRLACTAHNNNTACGAG